MQNKLKMKQLTEERLKESKEFKEWITGIIALIHNVYHDNKDQEFKAFIVLHSDMGKWTITRFFTDLSGEKIHVSNDYVDISTIEVFQKLLSEYSRGLK
jgi:hypothetical protein